MEKKTGSFIGIAGETLVECCKKKSENMHPVYSYGKNCFLAVAILVSGCTDRPAKVCFWNIENFGQAKDTATVRFIAGKIKTCDVAAIAEVAPHSGSVAIKKLHTQMMRYDRAWCYSLSDTTTSSQGERERYAIFWNGNRIKKTGKSWLDQNYQQEIVREPYMATFRSGGKEFTLVVYHAVPKDRQPEREIKYMKNMPALYTGKNLIFAGDFNCPQSHTVFLPIKQKGYQPILSGQKTTLKKKCINGDCLASELDNIFYDTCLVTKLSAGVMHFYNDFHDIRAAHKVSDHLPIYFVFQLK